MFLIYNAEKFLKDCLNSLLEQNIDKTEYEIICVDDGSTDSSYEILKDYALKNSNIVIIQQENGGVSSARNKGIEMARGKYLWFVDSDDYIMSNILGTVKQIINVNDIPLIRLSLMSVKYESLYQRIDRTLTFSIINSAATSSNVLTSIYQKKILLDKNIRFNEQMKYGEDTLFSYYFYLASSRKHAKINEAIYFYRDNPHSVMHKKDLKSKNRHCLDLIEMSRIYKRIYESKEIIDVKKHEETARRQAEAIQGALTILPQCSLGLKKTLQGLKREGLYPYTRTKWKIKESKGFKSKTKATMDSFICFELYYNLYYLLKKILFKLKM